MDKKGNIFVVVGVLGNLVNVKVSFTLKKARNKGSSTTKTKNPTFTAQDYSSDSPPINPAELWCPAEDTIIYTDGDNVVSQVCLFSSISFFMVAQNVIRQARAAGKIVLNCVLP